MMRSVLSVFSFLLALVSTGTAQERYVFPAATDPAINQFLSPHFVVRDAAVESRGLLFLFFPGTGGRPIDYREITRTAADAGFHAIALSYVNGDSINFDICGPTGDLQCYEQARMEILDGTDRTPLVTVNRANSAENRLIKLLQSLQQTDPNENWNQFLSGDTVNWSKVVTAGHSQGGGHAAILGKKHLLRRVLMFAAMDWSGPNQMPASWITNPGATPESAYWAFTHQRDPAVPLNLLATVVWPAYGMDAYGPPLLVDGTALPFGSHSLYSNADASSNNYHGCIVADLRLERLSNGVPLYRPVWEYMLTADLPPAESVVHVPAASFNPGPLAPGSIVAAFGNQLSAVTQAARVQPLPEILGGVRVDVIDSTNQRHAASLIFVSPGQVNYVMPDTVALGDATVELHRPTGSTLRTAIHVQPLSPGIFTANGDGAGVPAAWLVRVQPDGQAVRNLVATYFVSEGRFVPTPIAPLAAGEKAFLELYGTGMRNRSSIAAVTATIADVTLPVLYLGAQGSFAGLDQVNLAVPAELNGAGLSVLRITVDGKEANPVDLLFQ